jgi:hypothetical protein
VLKITANLCDFVTLSTFVVDQVLAFLPQQGSVLELCDPFCVRPRASCLELSSGKSSVVYKMCRNAFLSFCLSWLDIQLLRVQTVREVFKLLYKVCKENDLLTISYTQVIKISYITKIDNQIDATVTVY